MRAVSSPRHGTSDTVTGVRWWYCAWRSSKIQIKYIDTKNQLTDILTKGSFTRDEWNHLLCFFNIRHFSSTVVTAKSRPMMNLVARTPSVVSSSTSVSPVKRSYGDQNPSSFIFKEDRSERLDKATDLFEASDHHEQFMESFSSARYSGIGWRPCLVFSKVENWDCDVRPIGATWQNFWENWTQSSTWSRRNSSRRNCAIRKGRESTSWQIGATWWYQFWRRGKTSKFRHEKRWHRIGIVWRIKIIRESGEWSSAKKTEKNFKRCKKRMLDWFDLGQSGFFRLGPMVDFGQWSTWANLCVCWSKICALPDFPPPPPALCRAQNFDLFSPSRHNFFSFFALLGVLTLNFGGVLKAGTLKCARLGSRAVVWSPSTPSGAPPLHELCLPTMEDGRVRERGFWPKSNKSPWDFFGLSRMKAPIGPSLIGPSRARPHRMRRRTSYDFGNVYGCNNGISDARGKEFPKQP